MLATAPASATELVDDDLAHCPNAQWRTIQEGVDAASPGEVVSVCNGVYEERVTIAGSAKDGVRLRAKVNKGATIDAPDAATGPSIVTIDGADRVELSRFRITGPLNTGGVACPTVGEADGVLITGDSTQVNVRDNWIRDINDGLGGICPTTFIGIRFHEGRGIVASNRIEEYQNVGVWVLETGSFADVWRNVIAAGAIR